MKTLQLVTQLWHLVSRCLSWTRWLCLPVLCVASAFGSFGMQIRLIDAVDVPTPTRQPMVISWRLAVTGMGGMIQVAHQVAEFFSDGKASLSASF